MSGNLAILASLKSAAAALRVNCRSAAVAVISDVTVASLAPSVAETRLPFMQLASTCKRSFSDSWLERRPGCCWRRRNAISAAGSAAEQSCSTLSTVVPRRRRRRRWGALAVPVSVIYWQSRFPGLCDAARNSIQCGI